MKNLPVLLIAFLLPACVSRSFSAGESPAEPFGAFDYVKVQDFEVGDVSHLPLSDQMQVRNLAGMLSRKVHLEIFRRGMLVGDSGNMLVISGKITGYDAGEWSTGQSAVFLTWLSQFPPPSLLVPLPWPIWPVFPPLLPSKTWGYAGTGGIVVETTFTSRDGTVIATGTAEVDVSASTAGGNIEYATRDLAASIADFVESNY